MPWRDLPRIVIVLGLVSLFNDAASEMVVPLIPIWLVALGQGPLVLGLVEGMADAASSLLKLWSGRRSDRIARRKGLAVGGYALSNTVRPLIGLVGHWWGVLALRTVDRFGKGIRTVPRDAMLADAAPPLISAYAYGFHRAMDNVGAVAGALIAALILSRGGVRVSDVLLVSAIPGVMAVLLIAVVAVEAPRPRSVAVTASSLSWNAMPLRLRRYLWALSLFAFAKASEVFLVLRARVDGFSIVQVLLLWAAFNAAKAMTAGSGGRMADRFGNRPVLLVSWSAHAVGFVLMGLAGMHRLWPAAIFYGLFAGFGEGAERAQIRELADDAVRGTAFGWYHLIIGLSAIPGGLLFGAVWHFDGVQAAFGLSAALMGGAVVMMAMSA